MKAYETLKKIVSNSGKIATGIFVASLPYICEGCEYFGGKANAAETRQEVKEETPDLVSIIETTNIE